MTLRILPVGDSITQGQNVSYGSYRRHLYELLTNDGLDVEFVGSLSDGSFPSPDHDGVTGDVINGAWGRLSTGLLIETYTPDVILLLIGTNDVWLGDGDIPAALGRYNSMLNSIITQGPNVKTLVGSLPPIAVGVAGATVSSNVNVFNAGLATLVASKGAKFSFVDINAGMTTGDLVDGVHPTDAGNDIMAAIWYAGYNAAFTRFTAFEFLATGASELRTLPDRLIDAINVLDWGADRTGVADSADAFDAALEAARSPANIQGAINLPGGVESLSKAHGIIYIPRGTYLLTRSIFLTSAGPGRDWGFTIRGESAGSTTIFGDFDGFLFDTGPTSGMTGGFMVEGITFINYDTTPTSSGCFMHGGQQSITRDCVFTGMVGLAMQSFTCWQGGVYGCAFIGPGFGIASLGCSISTDGGMVSSCYFENWDVALGVNFDVPAVKACRFERNRVALRCGHVAPNPDLTPGSGFTTPGGIGAGTVSSPSIMGCSFKSNGTAIEGRPGSAIIAGIHIDLTPATDISPDSGDNAKYGFNFGVDGGGGGGSLVGTLIGAFVTGGPPDSYAYNLAGGSMATWIGANTDVVHAKRWSISGSALGGTAVPYLAKRNQLIHSDFVPVWKYADLPEGGWTSASIDDTTLVYDAYTSSLQLDATEYPRHVFGPSVAVGTLATTIGTQLSNCIVSAGDTHGVPGNVLTFASVLTGPAPAAGAQFQIGRYDVASANFAAGVDDGSATFVTPGNVFTCLTLYTLTNATISDGGAGAGNIVECSSMSPAPTGFIGYFRLAIDISEGGGIPRETWTDGIRVTPGDDTAWYINRDLHITTPTTMYLVPYFCPGIAFHAGAPEDPEERPSPQDFELDTELSLTQWTGTTTECYGPAGPQNMAPSYITDSLAHSYYAELDTELNANQWTITGGDLDTGPFGNAAFLPLTIQVSPSQTVASEAMTFVIDVDGSTYEINDSPTPAWTGSASNVGKAITTGGGSYRVRVRFDETQQGFVIRG